MTPVSHWCCFVQWSILIDLRTKWICPNCLELSPTRHWSVERHIRRKHTGIGEPVSINTHQTRTQMNIGSGWSNFTATANQHNLILSRIIYKEMSAVTTITIITLIMTITLVHLHQTYQNNNTNFSAAQNNFSNEKIRREFTAPHTGKRSIIDDEFLDMFSQMVEIKKFLGQNQLSSGVSASIGDIQQQFIGRQISGELLTQFLIHKNIIDNNRNVGLRGRLCYKCFSYWIDLVHNNKDEGMKMKAAVSGSSKLKMYNP